MKNSDRENMFLNHYSVWKLFIQLSFESKLKFEIKKIIGYQLDLKKRKKYFSYF